MTPLLFNLFILAASLYILYKSADLIVFGISEYARKLGLSDAIIGLIVIAIAASSPEITSSLMGFLGNRTDIGFGAILGSNLVHVGLALGIISLVGKKVELEPTIFTKQKLFMWSVLMLPLLLALDGQLSRSDGIVLVIAFGLYIARLWRIEGTLGRLKKDIKFTTIWRDVFVFLGSFAALLLAGKYLVFSSVNIGYLLGLPSYLMALTIIGIGTTIPDLTIELRALFRQRASIGIGDLLGSLIIEIVLYLGIISIIKPITIDTTLILNALIFLAITTSSVMLLMRGKEINWKHGLVFIALYLIFILIELLKI